MMEESLGKTKQISKQSANYYCHCHKSFGRYRGLQLHLLKFHREGISNRGKLVCLLTPDRQIYVLKKNNIVSFKKPFTVDQVKQSIVRQQLALYERIVSLQQSEGMNKSSEKTKPAVKESQHQPTEDLPVICHRQRQKAFLSIIKPHYCNRRKPIELKRNKRKQNYYYKKPTWMKLVEQQQFLNNIPHLEFQFSKSLVSMLVCQYLKSYPEPSSILTSLAAFNLLRDKLVILNTIIYCSDIYAQLIGKRWLTFDELPAFFNYLLINFLPSLRCKTATVAWGNRYRSCVLMKPQTCYKVANQLVMWINSLRCKKSHIYCNPISKLPSLIGQESCGMKQQQL